MPNSSIWKNNKFRLYSSFYYKGLAVYWILLVLFFIILIALPLIKVDVSTQSRGTIKTADKISPISSGLTGKITYLNISENQTVHQGDTLLILEQTGIKTEISIAKSQIELFKSYISDINILLLPNKQNPTSTLYLQEQEDYLNEIKRLQRDISKKTIDFERTKQLFNENVVPIAELQEDSFLLKSAEDELQVFKTTTLSKWELDKSNFSLTIQDLQVKIDNLFQKKNQYTLTAPFSGNVISFNGIAKGSIIKENETIAMLSPIDDLLAECYVSPSDIGLIRQNMPVKIMIDSYNYNQWGLMEATVVSISHDVINQDGQFVYVVKSKMHSDHLTLNNGLKGYLKKGMTITGRFIVTQRSLLQLLFDNINDWLNPRILQPETKE
nr:HlyD family efflux transporter periplasmic adaptor subunit [uncultured Carboxylicivirga sp.]